MKTPTIGMSSFARGRHTPDSGRTYFNGTEHGRQGDNPTGHNDNGTGIMNWIPFSRDIPELCGGHIGRCDIVGEVPDARLVFIARIDFTDDEKRRLGDLHRKHHRPDAVDPDGRYIATDMKSWWCYSFRSRDGEPFIFKDPYIRLNSPDRAIIIKAIESYMGMGPYAD